MGSGKPRQAVEKYLAGHSERETSMLNNIHKQYSYTLVIPLYDESFDSVYQLLSTPFSFPLSNSYRSVLFILVVNCPEGGDQPAAARTVSLLGQIRQWVHVVCEIDNVTYGELEGDCGVIIVDRCSEGRRIPKKQGVGLARKVGADIACYLIERDIVINRWIHSTDADVTLPVNYFESVLGDATSGESLEGTPIAVVYPFKHVPETGYEIACELYDWSLRYYVESIKWAGSGYSYHTIGSLIAVDFQAYAKVRGFPKRAGGEDFYLLNKLAKVGLIKSLHTPVINITARPSQRVPFGTGPAICKITENKHAIVTHVFYHPAIFEQLKTVYILINQSWNARDNKVLSSSSDILTALGLKAMDATLIDALDALGFVDAWKHAVKQSGDEQQFVKQMNVWFDAFKTLKFVHYMRDQGYASLTLKGVLGNTQMLSKAQLGSGHLVLSEELIDRAVKLLSM